GMAVVYLVEHQTLLKRFAAKVLSSELASSAEARARFAQEAHAASQLDHENIVTISDFGVTADQRPFFVMELLRGQTLDQRLGDGTMSIEEVVAVAVPVARALSTPTTRASCTATSSRRTSSWSSAARAGGASRSSTSGSPRRRSTRS